VQKNYEIDEKETEYSGGHYRGGGHYRYVRHSKFNEAGTRYGAQIILVVEAQPDLNIVQK